MEWYYVENGERKGPVPDEELLRLARERVLTPDDLVWHAELGEQWQKASVVPGLFDAEPPETAEPPPPLPAQPPVAGARPDRLSCVDPVSRAWQRMVTLLFRPFALATWFGLGFTAWLATLGQGGGSGGGIVASDGKREPSACENDRDPSDCHGPTALHEDISFAARRARRASRAFRRMGGRPLHRPSTTAAPAIPTAHSQPSLNWSASTANSK